MTISNDTLLESNSLLRNVRKKESGRKRERIIQMQAVLDDTEITIQPGTRIGSYRLIKHLSQ
ncbi:MAG TPA: hypothetical protein VEI53_06910, partial [Ktedonobacteraceae bacterium]|nr:hypothetical protein [Ktedonobacteraceae bacterium]